MFQPQVNVSHSKRITRNKALRFLLISILMIISFTFGALIPANAGTRADSETKSAAAYPKVSNNVAQLADAGKSMKLTDVGKGDTLWSIAKRHAPKDEDIRTYIDKIMRVNGLQKPTLQEGQLLYLP